MKGWKAEDTGLCTNHLQGRHQILSGVFLSSQCHCKCSQNTDVGGPERCSGEGELWMRPCHLPVAPSLWGQIRLHRRAGRGLPGCPGVGWPCERICCGAEDCKVVWVRKALSPEFQKRSPLQKWLLKQNRDSRFAESYITMPNTSQKYCHIFTAGSQCVGTADLGMGGEGLHDLEWEEGHSWVYPVGSQWGQPTTATFTSTS